MSIITESKHFLVWIFSKHLGVVIAVIMTVATAVFSLYSWHDNLERTRISQSVDLIFKLDQQYADIKKSRKKAAVALLSSASEPSSDVDEVLGFYETMGMLVRKGALDKEMAWDAFYDNLHSWVQSTTTYIAAARKRDKDSTLWEES